MENKHKILRVNLALAALLISGNASAALVSDLYITEVMTNPAAVSDTVGEWFELYNPTLETVDLSGITLSDDGSNSHVISSGSPLIINPGEYFVMASNGDPMVNGGFTANYVYSGFSLTNSADEIVFSDNGTELLRLNYTSGFGVAGNSMELLAQSMDETNYGLTAAGLTYGLGDIGTPGAAGSFTPASPVPVPAAAWLFGSGLLGLLGISRKRKSRNQ